MSLFTKITHPIPGALLALTLLLPACQPADSDSQQTPWLSAEAPTVETQASELTEMWDLMTISGRRVGYQVTRIQNVIRDGQPLREVDAQSEMTLRRFGQVTRQQMEIASLETRDGRLLRFQATLRSGQSPMQTMGIRQNDVLRLTTTVDGKSQSWSLPLPADCGGLFAVENSLLQRPMRPGENRSLKMVVPVLHVVGAVELRASDCEVTDLRGEARELLRIDSQLTFADGQTIKSQMWTDTTGQILKSRIPALQQVAYRVDRQTALQTDGLPSLDLADFSLVRVGRSLPQPHQTGRIRYRARLAEDNPSQVFPTTRTQTVHQIDERTAEIVVTAVGSGGPPTAPSQRPPEEKHLLPSPLVQSDDPTVRQLAEDCGEADADAQSTALAIERFVHGAVTEKNFTTAFATAAEVARTREGDCTEHAVLTAALCRARGIPARAVVGLVYVSGQQAFAFHMWNEAWVEDHWMPLDATLGRHGIGATRLTLGHSALDSGHAFAGFLPVIQVLGQLELEIVDVRLQETGGP